MGTEQREFQYTSFVVDYYGMFVLKVSLADVERHSRVYLTYYLVHSMSCPLINIIQQRSLCVYT